jgi:glycerol-3-phosphate O-acyltransferase
MNRDPGVCFVMRQSDVETVPTWLKGGRFRHEECVFDRELPWLLRKVVLGLSARVRIFPHSVEAIREAARTSHVVYALKFPSAVDLHFLRIRFAELGLPVPVMTLGGATRLWSVAKKRDVIREWLRRSAGKDSSPSEKPSDVLKTVLLNGSAGVFFLVDDDVFRQRYVHPDKDPLGVILECQGGLPGAISLVPLTVLHDRTPRPTIRPFWETFLGDPDRPGLLRRIAGVMRKWTVPEVLVGDPINLVAEFEEFGSESSWDELPFQLRTRLISHVNDRIRVNRGPEQPSKMEIKERVLRDDKVGQTIADIAAGENISQEKLRKKAESYVEEIAAARSMRVIWVYFRVLRWVFKHIFDGIDSKEAQFTALKDAGRKGPLIFVSCHKSHFDYLVVPFLAFSNNIAIPYVAAGTNLAFWPLGPLLRHGAAFFMRRSFKGLDLYKQVFVSYLKVLLMTGHSLKFYAEGGRSRIGRLLPPRLGLLGFLLEAVEDGAVDNLTFVPAFIGYEQVPEESSYLSELAGRDKKKETIGSLLNAREVLSRRYGKLYVRFHPTVSLADFGRRRQEFLGDRAAEPTSRNSFLEDLGYHLMAGIVRSGVVSPVETSAHAILCSPGETFALDAIVTTADRLFEGLAERGTETAGGSAGSGRSVRGALTVFESKKFIVRAGESAAGEPLYKIAEDSRKRLEFYANGLVNYLWPISLAATLASDGIRPGAPPYSDFSALKTLLRRELIPDPLDSDRELLDEAFRFLFETPGTGSGPRECDKESSSLALGCFSRLTADLMRTYLHVVEELEETSEDLSIKDLQKRVVARAMKERTSEDPLNSHALSHVVVGNAVTRLHEMGLLDYNSEKKLVSGAGALKSQGLLPWRTLLRKHLRD